MRFAKKIRANWVLESLGNEPSYPTGGAPSSAFTAAQTFTWEWEMPRAVVECLATPSQFREVERYPGFGPRENSQGDHTNPSRLRYVLWGTFRNRHPSTMSPKTERVTSRMDASGSKSVDTHGLAGSIYDQGEHHTSLTASIFPAPLRASPAPRYLTTLHRVFSRYLPGCRPSAW